MTKGRFSFSQLLSSTKTWNRGQTNTKSYYHSWTLHASHVLTPGPPSERGGAFVGIFWRSRENVGAAEQSCQIVSTGVIPHWGLGLCASLPPVSYSAEGDRRWFGPFRGCHSTCSSSLVTQNNLTTWLVGARRVLRWLLVKLLGWSNM